MEELLKRWLETDLGDESARRSVRVSLQSWLKLPPPVRIEVASTVEDFIEPMDDEFKGTFKATLALMIQEWRKMQQDVADQHVIVYEHKNKACGYIFAGFANNDPNTCKWIVCGHPSFVEDYQAIENKDQHARFAKKYEKVFGSTDFEDINKLDEKFKEHRYQRITKFSAPKHDSGWVKI